MSAVWISAWSALSPYGHGRAAFADGLTSGTPAPLTSTKDDWAAADARVVPGFDIVEQLGRKGTGSMDRSSALAVATLRALQGDPVSVDATTGVVLGTTSGSTRTQFEFTRDSLTRRRPYFVNPAQMPFALMNSAAAQCAMWHGLTGPNSTVAAGRNSGAAAVRYAVRLLRTGRTSGVFVGAVEEHSGARELLAGGQTLGEGAVLFFLQTAESGNRAALAEVVATDTRFSHGAPRRALAASLRHVMAGLPAEEVWGLALSSATPELSEVEGDATGEMLGQVGEIVRPGPLIGDTGAASGAFGLAALLARAEDDRSARGRLAVATSVDSDGTAGAVVLRLVGTHQARGER
jgi:3-oxoacyl-[acyl-carrier-protein] synthase II